MANGIVISPEGTVTNFSGDGLKPLQEAVGGYIELVVINQKVSMYINEEGKFSDAGYNPIATAIAKSNNAIFEDDYIVGNAVFLGGVDENGDDKDLVISDIQSLLVRMHEANLNKK